jgi:extracellular factor (EF) 3-hydroxypalmitic acid methyl ester biosynthesis protein
MKQAIALLDQLRDVDVDWWLECAEERSVAASDELVTAGAPAGALHVVTQGVLGVFADETGARLATLGPGDLVGELSFLEDTPPTETVRAVEDATVLSLPVRTLRERTEGDPEFSARLHRTLGRLVARRLRDANSRLAAGTQRTTDDADSPAWQRIEAALGALKARVAAANEASAESGEVPEDMATETVEGFRDFCALFHEVLYDEVDNERVREELGRRVQQELLPYILLTDTAHRFYAKPRGYAGDYWMIELVYRNEPAGRSPVGRLIDRCVLETTASRSCRNRRGLLTEEIVKAIEARQGPAAEVTSLACGPAREVFDAFADLDDPTTLHANLLDIDYQALAFVADEIAAAGLRKQVSLVNGNLVRLALGKAHTDIADQDLVYSIGLIDYFSDDLVVRLMNLIHSMLRPGGRVILGNMHPRNTSRALMDHVLDWELFHRTEEDMDRLYETSAFGRGCTNVRFEGEGINLFAECVR